MEKDLTRGLGDIQANTNTKMPWEDTRSHPAQSVREDFLREVACELVKKGRGEPEGRESQAEGTHNTLSQRKYGSIYEIFLCGWSQG